MSRRCHGAIALFPASGSSGGESPSVDERFGIGRGHAGGDDPNVASGVEVMAPATVENGAAPQPVLIQDPATAFSRFISLQRRQTCDVLHS